VFATAVFAGVPVNDPDFNLIFTTAVVNTLKTTYPSASVTLFSVTSSGSRRAGETTVAYRVEVAKDEVLSASSLTTALGDLTALNSQMSSVGGSVSGELAAYSSASTTFSKKPAVNQIFTTTPVVVTNTSSESSSLPIGAIIGGIVGAVVVIALIILVVIHLRRSRKKKTEISRRDTATLIMSPGSTAILNTSVVLIVFSTCERHNGR
jgi:uncharacterized BrkB/YihY/UPF0761 family membrane protein